MVIDADALHFHSARLAHAFHMVMGAAARDKAERFILHGMPDDLAREMVEEQKRQLRENGLAEAGVEEIAQRLLEAYAKPPDLLPEEQSFAINTLVEQCVGRVVDLWLTTLHETRGKVLTDIVFLMLLDDAMLPSMDPDSAAEFDRQCFLRSALTGDEVRGFLRELRSNLPGGALLLPDAMAILGIAPPKDVPQA